MHDHDHDSEFGWCRVREDFGMLDSPFVSSLPIQAESLARIPVSRQTKISKASIYGRWVLVTYRIGRLGFIQAHSPEEGAESQVWVLSFRLHFWFCALAPRATLAGRLGASSPKPATLISGRPLRPN
ncbi:uncharacterized protein VTP21DRAFT_11425 [Calcarisporiella thermophila]|uniref:uncharacterized protein n=1 Tax=Calcarisporiella thermophila TaxID=911321 RepID=UPI00374454C1